MPNAILTWTASLLLCATVAAAGDKVIHVAPNGRDSNPGTEARPLATVAAAQAAARKALAADAEANVIVECVHSVAGHCAPGAEFSVEGDRLRGVKCDLKILGCQGIGFYELRR